MIDVNDFDNFNIHDNTISNANMVVLVYMIADMVHREIKMFTITRFPIAIQELIFTIQMVSFIIII